MYQRGSKFIDKTLDFYGVITDALEKFQKWCTFKVRKLHKKANKNKLFS